ncbi:hypothetical protein [Paenibacillus filicis]|uniref:hypothetical protein n=1 Tax=Paenibacillus filicis TaxID=669464 RepID=UPI003119C1AE
MRRGTMLRQVEPGGRKLTERRPAGSQQNSGTRKTKQEEVTPGESARDRLPLFAVLEHTSWVPPAYFF